MPSCRMPTDAPSCSSAKPLPILGVLLLLSFQSLSPTSIADPAYLGIRFGTSLAEVLRAFRERGIPTEEVIENIVSAPRPLEPIHQARLVRLYFKEGKLGRMTLFFKIPPPEPAATRVLKMYHAEQNRLIALFGSPLENTVEMKSPSEQDRYEWLARARGYYRSVWVTADEVRVSLWLYGSDEGVVLLEVYERNERTGSGK